MNLLRANKYRLLPDEEQLNKIKQFCGCSRVVYNALLEMVITSLNNKENINVPKVTELYDKYEFLKQADSLALANARLNLQKAVNDFFKSKKGKRKGKRLGFPKFKKKNKSKCSYTTNNQSGSIRIEDNTIKIPKIGFVKFKQHKPINGIIKSITITVNNDGSVEVSVLSLVNKNTVNKQTKLTDLKVLGLDMSMDSFYVSSDGEKPNFTRKYRLTEKRRKRLNRSLHRKKMVTTGETYFNKKWNKETPKCVPSNNREKARIRLAKHERRIANQRKDFCHQLSRNLVNNHDVIVLEDINLQAMSRCLNLGKSVHDLGFGMFRTFLEYKSIETDSLVVKVPQHFASSKLCNDCGFKHSDLKLSERFWYCPNCGVYHDRDLNASYNLRDYFIKTLNTAGTAGINACGDNASRLRETLIQVLSLKQEGNIVKYPTEALPLGGVSSLSMFVLLNYNRLNVSPVGF